MTGIEIRMMETFSHIIGLHCNGKKLWCKAAFCFLILCLVFKTTQCKKSPNCSTCKEIVDNFHASLAATEKSNYGGGNTKWEEKSLGSYAFSEVRLVEVMEKLCDGKSKECHAMLEEHEDVIEHFWFREFAEKTNKDFHEFFCIDHMKACCPGNHYGPDCSACPGGVENPCKGNGRCSGEGTRGGSGECECSSGYKGDLCDECADGFYEISKNDTATVCKVCHISCKDLCSEAGPKGCDECKDGWVQSEENGCQDINECLEDPCDENQYCTNTQGSYTCIACDTSCLSCTGPGSSKCNGCKDGYDKLENGACRDKDECSLDPNLCSKENEECLNLPGSYECSCKADFEYKEGQCVAIPNDEEEEEEEEDSSDSTEHEKEEL